MRQTPTHILRRIREAEVQRAARLDLRGERLTHIPEEVYELTHLEELDLSGNLIQSVPDDLRRLTRLRQIDLRHNNLLHACPDVYGLMLDVRVYRLLEDTLSFENIIGLRCRHAQDRAIAQHFLHLTTLDVSFNRLGTLPEWLGQLTNLTTLDVSDNPIEVPPPEVVAGELEAIRTFFAERTAVGEDRLFEAKMLGGDDNVLMAAGSPEEPYVEVSASLTLF